MAAPVFVGSAVNVGTGVPVGVVVGMAMAVCVNPDAKVATAEVWIASTLMVGAGSGVGVAAPQALNTTLPNKAKAIRIDNLLSFFISTHPFEQAS
jgi:hypothetical protein